ncbi:spore coat associated protein CotJA [Dorea formicigenerans]|nr:spore coat associated protein CotJA [Dorea formicigenerans]MEE0172677.1 spore coat associated protein CotJA [Dorea formicigenerans]
MAYVPWTKWRNIYEAEKGLRRGTIFQDLDKPFRGIGGCQNGR